MTVELPVFSDKGNKDSAVDNEKWDLEEIVTSSSPVVKTGNPESTMPSHQTDQIRPATRDYEEYAPTPFIDRDTNKNSKSQGSKDWASIDKSITMSKKMFQQVGQTVKDHMQASNDMNDEIRAIQKASEIITKERLKEYSATVAELSDIVSNLLE